MEIVPGARLGSYEILSQLGSGGMGEVWRARHLMLDRQAAVKLIRADYLRRAADGRGKTLRRRFEREAKTTSQLRSPHTIQIYDFGTTEDGTFYYVMELIEGQDLHTLVEKYGPLPAERIVHILLQVCDSLAEAHGQGLIHRDIKPANILLTRIGARHDFVKVLDFGLVRPAPGSEKAGTLLTVDGIVAGSPAFMAPELVKGSEAISRSADIYSLGCVTYWLLTGQLVFEAESAVQAMAAHIDQQPDPPSARTELEIPAEIERIVMACLAKNPQQRPSGAEDLARQLASSTVRKPWTEERAEEWWRLHKPPAVPAVRPTPTPELLDWGLASPAEPESDATMRALGASPPAPIRSVAVLPLASFSGAPEDEYFVQGMTESLITDLAKIGSLRVISRTSVMRYNRTDKPLPEIARELNVDTIVEGSVLRSGNRVRITAQLIDAASDRHLWAESYERDMQDVLKLQSEVAGAIAREIQIKLSPQEQASLANTPRVDPEAYQYYLQGRFYWNKRTEQGFRKGIEFFEDAIARDPQHALAYAGLADCYALLASVGHAGAATREAVEGAGQAARRAIELDDSLSEAHTSLGFVKFRFEWDWAGAEREFRRAIELQPGYPTAHHWYATYLGTMGRMPEALAEVRRALALDPLSLTINAGLARLLSSAGQLDRAVEQIWKIMEMEPTFTRAYFDLGLMYAEHKKAEEAVAALQKAANQDPENPQVIACLAYAHALAGNRDEAERVLVWLEEQGRKGYVSPFLQASIHAGLGENDRAIALLEKGYEVRATEMVYLKTEPFFEPLRPDPRFQDLLRRMNFI